MAVNEEDRHDIDRLLTTLKHGEPDEARRARAALVTLRSSRAHREYLLARESDDRVIAGQLDALRLRYPRAPDSLSHASKRAEKHRRTAVTASIVLFTIATVAIWWGNPELSQQAGASAVGEQRTFQLDDGSSVLLNTGSAVHFSNRLRSREVVLDRGEVLFTVTHSIWRPFHVRTQGAHIADLGTRFSVRQRASGVEVAVLDGQVAVTLDRRPEPVVLAARQAIRTDGARISPASVAALTAWTDQRLDFNRMPLAQVIEELQRYSSTAITLADARAARVRISGGFSSSSPHQLLALLPAIAPVTVQFRPDGSAVIASR
ncbi:TPA: DUF4974 domain-containing protein [Burkholderia cenocepacia]|nr:DUF4974 domain-containing protein [Burkholderia cenocepacia]HDR9888547.1 DUF4974 domain-containing protein [Burkholderia cenocepacia]